MKSIYRLLHEALKSHFMKFEAKRKQTSEKMEAYEQVSSKNNACQLDGVLTDCLGKYANVKF